MATRRVQSLARTAVAQAALDALEPRLCFSTFAVSTIADTGVGSLRQAIADANATPGADTIKFGIGSGLRTITLLTPLPAITDAVTIDGTTQGGYAGAPLIQVTGAATGVGASGLHVTAGDSTVIGLIINRFSGPGVWLDSNNNVLLNSWIGVDSSGLSGAANGEGVRVTGAKNTIGGPTRAELNVISGNTAAGVHLVGAASEQTRVLGNYIGLRPGGAAALANLYGVYVDDSPLNTIGGNVISGNGGAGVLAIGTSARQNLLQANLIGTDLAGVVAVPNGDAGVVLTSGANRNQLGGTNAADGNVIGGNAGGGVLIANFGTDGNVLQSNRIGLAADRTATVLPNIGFGVGIRDGATGNLVGDEAGNVISGNGGPGVRLFVRTGGGGGVPTSNVIQHNVIGADPTGRLPRPNFIGVVGEADDDTLLYANVISANTVDGVYMGSSTRGRIRRNFVGVTADGAAPLGNGRIGINLNASVNVGGPDFRTNGNLISGNGSDGIFLSALANVAVQGNVIGLDVTGRVAFPNNGDGVAVSSSFNTLVGGTGPGEGNVISGNVSNGVHVFGAISTGNLIRGNLIGLDVTGTLARGNLRDGVVVDGSAANTIGGGDDPAARNVISGNGGYGVEVLGAGADDNVVQGNYIGTDAAGAVARPNTADGVLVGVPATRTLIGGETPGAGNLISGNTGIGVQLASGANRLQGNRIGTDVTGMLALPNHTGLQVSAANLIGGTATASAGNLISGNLNGGIFVGNGNGSLIVNNVIGAAADRVTPLPNGSDGLRLDGASQNTIVGGAGANARNVIAYNAGAGVSVRAGIGHAIFGNSIHDNAGLGIDLGGDGVTPNDPGDTDAGPNDLQNAPSLATVVSTNLTKVTGSLDSTPSTLFFLDFYASPTADPSGFGEGARHLGSATVTTNALGNAAFSATLPGNVPVGQVITATASMGGGAGSGTSEFSNQVVVTDNVSPTVVDAKFNPLLGPDHRIQITFSEDVLPPTPADFDVFDTRPGGPHVPVTRVEYDPAGHTATAYFGGILPDANYRAVVRRSILDRAGNALDGNADFFGGDDYNGFDFFFMNADADRNRRVDFNDLVILAQNYNTAGRAWNQADFNYDHTVDFNDLVILAQRYNTFIAGGAPTSPGPAAPLPPLASVFSPAKIGSNTFSDNRVRIVPDLPVVVVKPPTVRPIARRGR